MQTQFDPGIQIKDPTDRMQQIIEEKRQQTKQLKLAINDYVTLKLGYEEAKNQTLLTTDFKAVLDESRPTVAMKDAYIENILFDQKSELRIARENVECIKREIEILNNEIKLYELKTHLMLQKEE